jgi:nucleotide-binding universal stress UspA family protein
MKRILHATDFSKAARPAFKKAVEMAKRAGAALELLYVMGPVVPIYGDAYVSPHTYDQIAARGTEWAHREMAPLVKKARAAGVKVTPTIIVDGAPADRIVRAARATHADLVVVGTHGRTGFSRWLLGSVASRVVATAPCPVLTVRGG